jgi:hypothetical protein
VENILGRMRMISGLTFVEGVPTVERVLLTSVREYAQNRSPASGSQAKARNVSGETGRSGRRANMGLNPPARRCGRPALTLRSLKEALTSAAARRCFDDEAECENAIS